MTKYEVTIVVRSAHPDAGKHTGRGVVPLLYAHAAGVVRARSISTALDRALSIYGGEPLTAAVEVTTPAGRTHIRWTGR